MFAVAMRVPNGVTNFLVRVTNRISNVIAGVVDGVLHFAVCVLELLVNLTIRLVQLLPHALVFFANGFAGIPHIGPVAAGERTDQDQGPEKSPVAHNTLPFHGTLWRSRPFEGVHTSERGTHECVRHVVE
jgi:hypothetical protein